MTWRALRISALLFGSGACALTYQMVWLRELRLVFGGSTAASAAVLAIFMGGLGLGAAVLGRRVEGHSDSLRFYATLELYISLFAVLTPILFGLVRFVYVGLGGSATMGLGGSTVIRLLLATVVLAPPTFMMGGTLPAAARAISTASDTGRRGLAIIYGMNALGGVVGVALATFVLLEAFGARNTLFAACVLNVAVALLARRTGAATTSGSLAPDSSHAAVAPAQLVLVSAGLVGFAFFLMELVWYRMLTPLLGGSTYTFGLILALVLLGIGFGAWVYGRRERLHQPHLVAFSVTCTLEAVFVALPLALGDRLAVFASLLRPLGQVGFGGLVLGWVVVAGIVVLPAAVVAGYQFPLLVGLLGRGRTGVARDAGRAYAWNTVGSIIGSLAGGFGLLPLLTAIGLWRGVVLLLLLVAGVAGVTAWRREPKRWLAVPVGLAALALLPLFAQGPTAAWRHSAIGAGRADLTRMSVNQIHRWKNDRRRITIWEADGVEASVALEANDQGLAFVVNGKVDGNCHHDRATQVMSGLVPAVLHPRPERALVVGLGTGTTAGWLAQVPTVTAVDVVELEPAILEVARRCESVNHRVLQNPAVNIIIGDGREVLLTTGETYDLIVSEPSNPYRAGIASMYTAEYYAAARERLASGGIFVQWLQAYEIDLQTLRTVYATVSSVFPSVQTWRTGSNDLLLVCSLAPLDGAGLRDRVASEPIASAMVDVWDVASVEGFWSHFVAGPEWALRLASAELNTDDNMRVEFGFARTVGHRTGLYVVDMIARAHEAGVARPSQLDDQTDLSRVDDHVGWISMRDGGEGPPPQLMVGERAIRTRALRAFSGGHFARALELWRRQSQPALEPYELALIAAGLVESGDAEAPAAIEALRPYRPAVAELLAARYHWGRGDIAAASLHLASGMRRAQSEPWCPLYALDAALRLIGEMAEVRPELAPELADLLSVPWASRQRDARRTQVLLAVADRVSCARLNAVLEPLEPSVPWQKTTLRRRAECYARTGHRLAERAAREWAEFRSNEPEEL